ncbi:MAG: hypothetical protein PHP93_09135, partial [Kiritimatiellales bacterium]|nr:hypothetical protein [Kiritimatiellales bacterium]
MVLLITATVGFRHARHFLISVRKSVAEELYAVSRSNLTDESSNNDIAVLFIQLGGITRTISLFT